MDDWVVRDLADFIDFNAKGSKANGDSRFRFYEKMGLLVQRADEAEKYRNRKSWDDMKALLGGKGANLAEMTRIDLPVPPGFTVTTEACNAHLKYDRKFRPVCGTKNRPR